MTVSVHKDALKGAAFEWRDADYSGRFNLGDEIRVGDRLVEVEDRHVDNYESLGRLFNKALRRSGDVNYDDPVNDWVFANNGNLLLRGVRQRHGYTFPDHVYDVNSGTQWSGLVDWAQWSADMRSDLRVLEHSDRSVPGPLVSRLVQSAVWYGESVQQYKNAEADIREAYRELPRRAVVLEDEDYSANLFTINAVYLRIARGDYESALQAAVEASDAAPKNERPSRPPTRRQRTIR